jgi:hypothetical protein
MFPYRSRHSFVNRACRLKIRWDRPKPKRTFCKSCSIEIFSSRGKGRKKYKSKGKSGLCKKCSDISRRKPRPVKITKKYEQDWTKSEIEKLEELYSNNTNKRIGIVLNRKDSSISHKANRLGLKKPREFFVLRGNERNMIGENPMKNPIYKEKARQKILNNYKTGKAKLSGIALKSHLGLTKKENHPNWLGGISFEPYDKNFDENFCKLIRQRDGCCLICNKLNENELREIGQSLCVHHLDYNKKNTCKENCLSLCNSCHCKTNYNRSSWIKFFQTILSDKYGYDYQDNQN